MILKSYKKGREVNENILEFYQIIILLTVLSVAKPAQHAVPATRPAALLWKCAIFCGICLFALIR
jgi:hypothetical protein